MLNISISDKTYNKKSILKDIEISIEKEGLYGIVGKNGSGKTTFFKCIKGLTSYKGEIVFQNQKIQTERVAWCPAEPFLYEDLTVSEFMKFYRNLLGIKTQNSPLFDVKEESLIKNLSTGMRKKVYINAVLQGNYDIYLFDEPYNGLDIESVYLLKKHIENLSQKSIVLVSSHILETLKNCKFILLVDKTQIEQMNNLDLSILEEKLFRK